MSWRDQLQTASFRGVEFRFDSGTGEFGRRVALHEYPLRDKPYAEDLGRKARKFTLEMYVLGEDYMTQRDRLIAALEQAGSGALVHPRMGQMTVTVIEGGQVSESTREGGLARFSVTFIETGEKQYPGQSADTQALTRSAAEAAYEAVGAAFEDGFNVNGLPEFVALDALTMADDWMGQVINMASLSGLLPAPLTQFLSAAGSLRNRLGTLLRTPGNLVNEVLGLWGQVAGLFENPFDAYSQTRPLWNYTPPASNSGSSATPSGQQLSDNRTALTEFILNVPLITSAAITPDLTFASYNDAVTLREQIAAALDVRAEAAGDQVYPVLQSLRVAVIKDIGARGADLARLINYTPRDTLPALVIAHTLYQDASRDEEIITRNKIRHPGFVTGGQALEVLSNG